MDRALDLLNLLDLLGVVAALLAQCLLEEVEADLHILDFSLDQVSSCHDALDAFELRIAVGSGEKGEDNSEQWASTFKEAVRQMGTTVMVLAPWDHPVVLTRMWCLVREASGALALQRLYSFAPRI